MRATVAANLGETRSNLVTSYPGQHPDIGAGGEEREEDEEKVEEEVEKEE